MSRIAVGYVARAHGVRGEVRVHLHNPGSETLFDVEQVWIGGRRYEVENARAAGGAVLLALGGVAHRDEAHALRGNAVEVRREDVPLEDGEYLLADLEGCEVADAGGRRLGTVVRVEPGPQDRVVVHDDEVERIIPVVDAFVVEVDLDGRRLVVDLPDGFPETPLAKERGRAR